MDRDLPVTHAEIDAWIEAQIIALGESMEVMKPEHLRMVFLGWVLWHGAAPLDDLVRQLEEVRDGR